MTAVRHLALGCCLLCAAAGIVRIFWPENGFKPVINTVLVLYILASVVPLGLNADWTALGRDLRAWSRQQAKTDVMPDGAWQQYADSLARNSAAAALRADLAAAGIAAEVAFGAALCRVTLQNAADLDAARPIVAAACGALPWRIDAAPGGEAP